MSSQDDINTPLLAVIGLITALLVFAAMVLLLVLYYRNMQYQELVKVVNAPAGEYESLVARQRAQLAEYRVDRQANQIAIPVDRAMEIVVRQGGALTPPPAAATIDQPPAATPPKDAASSTPGARATAGSATIARPTDDRHATGTTSPRADLPSAESPPVGAPQTGEVRKE